MKECADRFDSCRPCMLGHSKIGMTMDRYADEMPGQDARPSRPWNGYSEMTLTADSRIDP